MNLGHSLTKRTLLQQQPLPISGNQTRCTKRRKTNTKQAVSSVSRPEHRYAIRQELYNSQARIRYLLQAGRLNKHVRVRMRRTNVGRPLTLAPCDGFCHRVLAKQAHSPKPPPLVNHQEPPRVISTSSKQACTPSASHLGPYCWRQNVTIYHVTTTLCVDAARGKRSCLPHRTRQFSHPIGFPIAVLERRFSPRGTRPNTWTREPSVR